MSRKQLNILLIGLNAILVLLLLINRMEPIPIFQFFGRLHPLVLHFPIVLIIAAFFFELLGRKSGENEYRKPAGILLWIGAFSAVITAIAGMLLALNGEYSGDSFNFHKWFGMATSIAILGIVFFNQRQKDHQLFMPSYGLVIVLIIVTGHFGATLTHGEGFLTDVFKENKTLALNLDAPVFDQIVFPILDSKCTSCHNESKLKGELLLTSKEGILKGGESGKVVVNGDSENSLLIQNLHLPLEDDAHMPPKGKNQLTNEEIKMLTWWVVSGASFDQPVNEIAPEDPIQVTLTSYFTPEEKINIDFVSPELIESLNSELISVQQISDDKPYLEVSIGNNSSLNNDDIKTLRKIREQVYTLDLGNSRVDNDILKEVSRFKNLNRLYLDNTAVDDDMVSVLDNLKNLEYLNLYGTKITLDGAEKIIELPELNQLYLWQTEIDNSAIKALQANYPGIEINGGLAEDSDFSRSQLVAPKMLFTSSFFSEKMIVEVDYSLSGTDIYYQLDEGSPQILEDGKIEISNSSKLTVSAKKAGWDDSPFVEQVFIKVGENELEKTSLKHQPKGSYQSDGVLTLFDLSKGSTNFKDGKWLGFNGDDIVVDIEFKKSKILSSVFISMIEDLGAWIFPPASIEIWGGNDPSQLKKLEELNYSAPEGPELSNMKIHQVNIDNKELKYLQILVKNYGILPDWHAGKGNPTWLFIDEIAFK